MFEGEPSAKEVALALHSAGCIEIGDNPNARAVSHGPKTGLYWNVVDPLLLHPDQLTVILDVFEHAIRTVIETQRYVPDKIVGVPDGMTHLAKFLSERLGIPQLVLQKPELVTDSSEVLEDYDPNQVVIVIEDVLNTGSSARKTIATLAKKSFCVPDVIALIARTRLGPPMLSRPPIRKVHSIFTSVGLAQRLVMENLLDPKYLEWVKDDYEKPYLR